MNTTELLTEIYSNPALLFEKLHPDFAVHAPGNSPVAGVFRGAEGMQKHMEQMSSLSNNTFSLTMTGTILADDCYGLVVTKVTAEREGKKLNTTAFGLWGFKDGLITDHWESVADQAHWDDFWS